MKIKNPVIILLGIYRLFSGFKGFRVCRFYPTCSEYSLEAVKKYGTFHGLWKGIKRITRCHPFCDGGYDPA